MVGWSKTRPRRLTVVAWDYQRRQEWILWMMERAATKNSTTAKFQLWQAESHPIALVTAKIAWQKLNYIHYNPVEAGFITSAHCYKYSSAIDYDGGKGLLDILLLDPIIV